MKVRLLHLLQRLLGYCLRHDQYGPCSGCHIERLLNQSAINPISERQMLSEFRALRKRFKTIMATATKEAMRPKINDEQFEAVNEEIRRWHADGEAWKARHDGPVKMSTHFDCEGGDR